MAKTKERNANAGCKTRDETNRTSLHPSPGPTRNIARARSLLTQVLLELFRLLELLLEGEGRKRPTAKLGKLGERLDPCETEGWLVSICWVEGTRRIGWGMG